MTREELVKSLRALGGKFAWVPPQVAQQFALQPAIVAEGKNYHKLDREKAIAALTGPSQAAAQPEKPVKK